MTNRIPKYFITSEYVRDFKKDARQYVVFESGYYYEVYVYKQSETDTNIYDIMEDHFVIPKQLFTLESEG